MADVVPQLSGGTGWASGKFGLKTVLGERSGLIVLRLRDVGVELARYRNEEGMLTHVFKKSEGT